MRQPDVPALRCADPLHPRPPLPADHVSASSRVAGLSGGTALAAAAALHLYWLAGGRVGATRVVPTTDGERSFQPGPIATATVAAALGAAACLYAGAGLGRDPRWFYRSGTMGAATVLVARALGDGRRVGFLKTERESEFAVLDTKLLAPLCAALAVAGAVAAHGCTRAELT
jgi:hypothetical protein